MISFATSFYLALDIAVINGIVLIGSVRTPVKHILTLLVICIYNTNNIQVHLIMRWLVGSMAHYAS